MGKKHRAARCLLPISSSAEKVAALVFAHDR